MSKLLQTRFRIAHAIQTARAENYSRHYETHCLLKSKYSDEARTELDRILAQFLAFPIPTLLGGTPPLEGWIPPRTQSILESVIQAGATHLLNPWYLTEQNFEQFQNLWKMLPEPEDLWKTDNDPVDNLWITSKNMWKTCGKPVEKLPTYPQGKYINLHLYGILKKLSTAC